MPRPPRRDERLPRTIRSRSTLLRNVPLPGDWAERAACRGQNTGLFFPMRGEAMRARIVDLCEACPVASYCRAYALRWPVTGYWGGMSEKQRQAWRKEHWNKDVAS